MKKLLRSSPQKILVIRLSSIGDIILTLPLLRRLREAFPHARIDFLVRREYSELLHGNPHLSQLILFDARSGRAGLRELRTRISGSGYDVILDLHGSLRSRYLCSFMGRPPLLRIRKQVLRRFLLVKMGARRYRRWFAPPPTVVEKYFRAAAALGISAPAAQATAAEFILPEAALQKARALWQPLQKEGFRLVMAPGARHFTKRWPAAYFAELINNIYRDFGWRTLLVGGVDDLPVISDIQSQVEAGLTRSVAGEISLIESIAVISCAPLLISNDSGLMHAGAALGKPQIALFGSTTRELGFFPANPLARVLENPQLSCRPCSHLGRASCPRGHFNCMLKITPQQVLAELRSMNVVS